MNYNFYKKCLMSAMILFSIGVDAKPVFGDYAETIQYYMESHIKGDYKNLSRILDNDAVYMISRNEHILVQTKRELITQMKQMADIRQNCSASYQILAKSEGLILVKVDFGYTLGSQHNFLVLQKNNSGEWKISQVCKFFDDNQSQSHSVVASN